MSLSTTLNNTKACRQVYLSYKYRAKTRKQDFELDFIQFQKIISKKCHYCGSSPLQERNCQTCESPCIYNGIDRKNSKVGYTISNSLPCCKICNRAKMDMKYSDFIAWIKKFK